MVMLNEVLSLCLQGAAILVLLQLGRYLSVERRARDGERKLLSLPDSDPTPSEIIDALHGLAEAPDQ